MSHLFKNNKYKKFYKIFKILIIIVILIIFSKSFLNYQGNKFNYITFSLLFNYLIIFAFRKNSTFFETFFSIFLWLGFWFKLSSVVAFGELFEKDGIYFNAVGAFNYSPDSFDKALIVSQIAAISFILVVFLEKDLSLIIQKN